MDLFSLKPTGIKKVQKGNEERERKKAEMAKIVNENQATLERLKLLENQLGRKSIRMEYIAQGKIMLNNFAKADRLRLKNRAEDRISGLKRIIAYEIGSGFDINHDIDEKYDNLQQGISYKDWLEFIIQYGLIASNECRFDDAYEALKIGLECNLFYTDSRRRLELQFCLIGVAFNSSEYDLVSQIARGYAFTGPYMITGLRLFCAALCGGPRAIQAFSIGHNQKFLCRQAEKTWKMLDSDPECLPKHALGVLFATYGHILFCGKSYSVAIDKYLYARTFLPKDPVINFSLGISFLHRATQKTESRHSNIIKARVINIFNF